MSNRSSLLGLFALLSLPALACSASTASDPPDEGVDEAAMTASRSCSPATYKAGLAEYKQAVAGAKKFLGGQMCDEGATRDEVAGHLQAAVASCAAFEGVIATSPWAKPARDVLADNLALPLLTGQLRVRDASGKAVYSGLAAALVGKLVYGPAPGAYGNTSKVSFAAGGVATASRLEIADDGAAKWTDAPASYAIGPTAPDGSIEITLTSQGKSTTYRMSPVPPVQNAPAERPQGPELILKPENASSTMPELRSMPSECEA